MKVMLQPGKDQADPRGGIGQVILAQAKYLPKFGVQLVDDERKADIVACHISSRTGGGRVDVLHCHGLYWRDLPHSPFTNWHAEANKRIIESARRARRISVPADWVAQPFRRDMRISPAIIPHGVDASAWNNKRNKKQPFVLWNKNRNSDVCDPEPAVHVASAGISVISTFAPAGMSLSAAPPSLSVSGVLPHPEMKALIQKASVYLATTIETFGVGTLEAMAAGVPIVGYAWGGTQEIVRNGVDGILVEPGDADALIPAIVSVMKDWEAYSQASRQRAEQYNWRNAAGLYASLYAQALQEQKTESDAVSIVITNYNYAHYVDQAIESALKTMRSKDELIVVDDGSTDGSPSKLLTEYGTNPRVKLILQENAGVAAARNAGIEAAQNEFITCLDADDQLHPDFVKTVAPQIASQRDVGVAFVGLKFLNNEDKPAGEWSAKSFDWHYQASAGDSGELPRTNIPTPSACMFRKEMWRRSGGYYQVYAPGEDTEFMTRSLSVGYRALPIDSRVKTTYRNHAAGASKTKKYRPIDTWHPWMRDKKYPMGAPTDAPPFVLSNAQPLVSVIIPVRDGHEDLVFSAIDSVLGQTWRSWEVILIDDTGSDTFEYPNKPAWKLRHTYPFVRLLKNTENPGPGGARNTGIEASTAPLVLFLDADDFLAPGALDLMVRQFSEAEGRYIYGNAVGINADGDLTELIFEPYTAGSRLQKSHPVTVLIQRRHAQKLKFDELLRKYEDWDFFVRCAINGFHGHHCGETILYIRDSSTRKDALTREETDRARDTILERYQDYFTDGGKKMAGCCGGGGKSIIQAKQAAQLLDSMPGIQMTGGQIMSNEGGFVRMEYTGQQRGARTYRGKNRRTYRGGNNPIDKFADVHPDDVETLAATGWWVVVRRASSTPDPVQVKEELKEAPVRPAAPKVDWRSLAADDEDEEALPSPTPDDWDGEGDPIPAMPMGGSTETGSEILTMTAAEVREAIPDQDKGTLLAWLEVEKEGKNRKTVIAAIEQALGF